MTCQGCLVFQRKLSINTKKIKTYWCMRLQKQKILFNIRLRTKKSFTMLILLFAFIIPTILKNVRAAVKITLWQKEISQGSNGF